MKLYIRYSILALFLWTLLIMSSVYWNITNEKKQTLELAKKEARANFNKDQAFRLWASRHGGVYVPPDERTPPNPYLTHIPDRDVITQSGKSLTLMNPAYVVRQLMEEYTEMYGIRGRITSLKVLNPKNSPDLWEQMALKKFESGTEEVIEIVDMDGKPYLRLMRPMSTKKHCLKCHAHQGYKEGEIRGGVGIALPMEPYIVMEKKEVMAISALHILFWIMGTAGIGFLFFHSTKRLKERIEAEKSLRESEEKFRVFFESAPELFYITSKDGTILSANATAVKVLGYGREKLIGTSINRFYTSDSKLKLEELKQKLIHEGYIENEEMTILTHGGDKRDILLSIKPFIEKTESETNSIYVQRDITDYKMLNEELSQYIYTISHDMKTPLRAIQNYSDFLYEDLEESLDGEQKMYLQNMTRAVRKAENLVEDLLEFSRVGRKELEIIEIDIYKFLSNLVSSLEFPEDVEITIMGKLPIIESDLKLLRQIFENLIINAVKFNKSTKKLIEIGQKTKENHSCEIFVKDNGIGIDPQYFKEIFQVFRRLHPPQEYDGTGIGLAIVKKASIMLKGSLHVESTPGEGSTFFITLPINLKEE